MLPLVIELFGARSKGRKPSPVPRIDSGKTCTSSAWRSSPSPGTAATPMNAPGFTSVSASVTTRLNRVFAIIWTVRSSPARVRTARVPPSGETLSIVARATSAGAFWATAGPAADNNETTRTMRDLFIMDSLPSLSTSIATVLRRGAERMGGIDAEDADLAGEEGQLLEGALQRRIVGMAVDVGEKLRGGKLAALHVALELGHVDPVGGEASERLVECRRNVAHPEDEGRHC